ncbi:MAG: hypothetical protein HYX92_17155 [Chloroflexi bacterium]|nr:hypothetical protein [Chloroflexota bacterium]
MQCVFFILADGAQVADGKLYILGGGWDSIHPEALPARHPASLAVVLSVPWDETNEKHVFRLDLAGATGKTMNELGGGQFEVGRPPDATKGAEQRMPLALPITLQLDAEGEFHVRLSVDGARLCGVPFSVVCHKQ